MAVDWNEARDLFKEFAEEYLVYLRNLFKKKRTAASHILVVMISEEQRRIKPYAVPVLYIPCQTLR